MRCGLVVAVEGERAARERRGGREGRASAACPRRARGPPRRARGATRRVTSSRLPIGVGQTTSGTRVSPRRGRRTRRAPRRSARPRARARRRRSAPRRARAKAPARPRPARAESSRSSPASANPPPTTTSSGLKTLTRSAIPTPRWKPTCSSTSRASPGPADASSTSRRGSTLAPGRRRPAEVAVGTLGERHARRARRPRGRTRAPPGARGPDRRPGRAARRGRW